MTRYLHGHAAPVVASHAARTVDNSAGYLLPHLTPGQRVLDMGCGPGSITLDLAQRVAPGDVVGVDASAQVVEQARAAARDAGSTGVTFEVVDAMRLPTPASRGGSSCTGRLRGAPGPSPTRAGTCSGGRMLPA